MSAEQIRKIIENAEYEVYGIRADSEIEYSVGDICCKSHQWWQDDPGEESGLEYNEEMECWDGGELTGTCALETDAESVADVVEQAGLYGEHITLIAGNVYQAGNDIGEIIIEGARVLAVIG